MWIFIGINSAKMPQPHFPVSFLLSCSSTRECERFLFLPYHRTSRHSGDEQIRLSFEEKKIHFKTFCCSDILLVWRHLWMIHLFPSKKCVRDLDLQSEMIIFESLLTTFEAIIISLDSWGSRKNWPDQITLSELVQIPDSKNMKIY